MSEQPKTYEYTKKCEHRNFTRLWQYLQRIIYTGRGGIVGQVSTRRTRILHELYAHASHFLDQLQAPYWIDFGTLLGYHRSGDVIPHDQDIDFAMEAKYYEKLLSMQSSLPKELTFQDKTKCHNGPKIKLNYKGFDGDIYFYEDLGDHIRSFENSFYPNERSLVPKSLIFPLQQVTFLNRDILAPANVQGYLEHVYGYLGTGGWRDQKTGIWNPPGSQSR